MTQKELVLSLKNVKKVYQLGKVELVALKGINLDISQGDFVTIMGPSGSGKSTLLNLVGCLDFPTEGEIFLEGKNISLMSESQLSQFRGKTIGFIFQEFNLLPQLDALENVALPMVFQGISIEERKKRAKELLELVGLGDRVFHQPAELSGGERQRVAIARAFANNPEIIIADEPTGNLDSTTGKKVMEILAHFHKNEGKTMIVVTHDPHIADYSEQIVNIKDGEIITNHKQTSKVLWSS